ncbi:DinB family protein [Paenibacillus sp. GCM10023248]|uniref:DinB family protein n=1 Tax=unclassified Paenibacillus TaxID=185978 RepID=UPI002379E993|nr:DinB family protein [Paenibacillus sp. MAHUQ-63]MDD9269404.1 DinB family protein [Paenibacillus sp. MAHUQ-63]
MREPFVFHSFNKQHDAFIDLVSKCPAELRQVVPAGFETNLLWHVGHVLVVTEFHVFALADLPQVIPATYQNMFAYRTKASDWTEEPPTWDILIAQLKEQRYLINETLRGKLEVPVKENFLKADNRGELLLATSEHLATHIGVASAMIQLLQEVNRSASRN